MFVRLDYYRFPIFFYLVALLTIIDTRCSAYTPPQATVEPLSPKGIRLSVPHESGITLVAYHVKFNDDFYSLEAGTISIDIIKPRNGRWVYEDHTTELKEGDVVYFWVHVVYQGLGYNLLNQEHRVTEFFNYDGTPVRKKDDGICATPSETKILGRDGQMQNTCPNQLIFEENFDSMNTTRWTVVEEFSRFPDFEFVVYKNSENNVKIQDGNLVITPTFLEERYGTNFVRQGTLDLDKCTGVPNTEDCNRRAFSLYVLPPILSGRINSKNSFAFLYGRIEIRAKFPQGDWIYPLLNLEVANEQHSSELTPPVIRVASAAGNPVLQSTEGTDLGGRILCAGAMPPIHKNRGETPHVTRQNLFRRKSDVLWSNDYHTYEIEWQRNRILTKVDKTIYGEKQIGQPFDQPFYVTLGLAVGGRGEFQDSCRSHNYVKPWKNVGSRAILDFYEARDNWANTWTRGNTDLKIDYVKIYAV